jgi:hypothetical protein
MPSPYVWDSGPEPTFVCSNHVATGSALLLGRVAPFGRLLVDTLTIAGNSRQAGRTFAKRTGSTDQFGQAGR